MKFIYAVLIVHLIAGIRADDPPALVCSATDIRTCQIPLEKLHDAREAWQGIVPVFTEDQAEAHCRAFSTTKACFNILASRCQLLDVTGSLNIVHAYKYFCDKKPFQVYLESRMCLNSAPLQQAGKWCNATLAARLITLLAEANKDHMPQQFCRYMNEYVSCVTRAVGDRCGLQAAQWQRQMLLSYYQAEYTYIHCQLNGTGKPQPQPQPGKPQPQPQPVKPQPVENTADKTRISIIAGSVCAVVLAVALLAATVAVYCRRKRRLRTPPPYGRFPNGDGHLHMKGAVVMRSMDTAAEGQRKKTPKPKQEESDKVDGDESYMKTHVPKADSVVSDHTYISIVDDSKSLHGHQENESRLKNSDIDANEYMYI